MIDAILKTLLTKLQADEVWQVLVDTCGASSNPIDRCAFVAEFTTPTAYGPTREWRFQGNLGFGGKFWFPALTVDCYAEDETPALRQAISMANLKLEALKQILDSAPKASYD